MPCRINIAGTVLAYHMKFCFRAVPAWRQGPWISCPSWSIKFTITHKLTSLSSWGGPGISSCMEAKSVNFMSKVRVLISQWHTEVNKLVQEAGPGICCWKRLLLWEAEILRNWPGIDWGKNFFESNGLKRLFVLVHTFIRIVSY